MASMVLIVPKWIEREFKRTAKEAWPKETFALVLGVMHGDRAHVGRLYWPDDVAEFATDKLVSVQDQWYRDAAKCARKEGLDLLGAAHSHPYRNGTHLRDRTHSEGDIDSAELGRQISGICVVHPVGTKGRLRSSMRWWGPMVGLKVEYE